MNSRFKPGDKVKVAKRDKWSQWAQSIICSTMVDIIEAKQEFIIDKITEVNEPGNYREEPCVYLREVGYSWGESMFEPSISKGEIEVFEWIKSSCENKCKKCRVEDCIKIESIKQIGGKLL